MSTLDRTKPPPGWMMEASHLQREGCRPTRLTKAIAVDDAWLEYDTESAPAIDDYKARLVGALVVMQAEGTASDPAWNAFEEVLDLVRGELP